VKFTTDQLAAINHVDGNLQLIACAGSGKTEVVARRIANLLKHGRSHGLAPRHIVAFTFTEKAAAELKERIITRCREELGDIHGMAEMYVGTIHGFCLDLLMTEVHDLLKFDVLNEVQQTLFIDRHSKASGLTSCVDLKGAPLRRYVDTQRYLSALNILREDEPDMRLLKGNALLDALDAYQTLLEERCHFDYSEILSRAVVEITNNQGLRDHLAKRVRYVIVDEYQDVNPIQEAIVWSLHDLGAQLCVVGDDDQTIYQWRGSDIENMLTFDKRYTKAHQIRLEANFRSSEGIIETARTFIEQNAGRLPKQMKPGNTQPYEAGDICALQFANPDAEAAYIVQTAKTLHGMAFKEPTNADPNRERGLAWSDMAILLRSVARNATPITSTLAAANIPYVIVGMNNLFDTGEAGAARELFYYMASRTNSDETTVFDAWMAADVGVSSADLKSAVSSMTKFRAALGDPTERFGFYSIQRTFTTFLQEAGVREERVPGGRGEVVFYNLGKFSQLISDFETIHYHSKPTEKYESFGNFLEFHAESAYPEGWQNNQYANPDAVRIMTVHQAKGMEWPVVFVPALIKNRFPSKAQGGRTVWHILPAAAIPKQDRYRGTLEDERRLFYVALTRSQKFLHLTYAPVPGNQLFQSASQFLTDIYVSKYVKRKPPDYSARKRLPPAPRKGVANVVFSFSDLKYFFECPYQFKLRILYGFNAPLHEALGYGRSLHNALAEVHKRALDGDFATPDEADSLTARHLHTPYAYPKLRENLEKAAERVISDYIKDNQTDLKNIEFSEKQIDITLDDGVGVVGRVDLVRRKDTGQTTIVDLKSNDRAQPEDVTETQLHVYALGYEELTGRPADFVEIYELDERKRKPRSVDNDFIDDVKTKVRDAAAALRLGNMPAMPVLSKCRKCDYCGMCTAGCKTITPSTT
jgi:DNA helicase-2/ATP-dependent DNA helicase PcrA